MRLNKNHNQSCGLSIQLRTEYSGPLWHAISHVLQEEFCVALVHKEDRLQKPTPVISKLIVSELLNPCKNY